MSSPKRVVLLFPFSFVCIILAVAAVPSPPGGGGGIQYFDENVDSAGDCSVMAVSTSSSS